MAARSQREQQEITLLQERSAGTFARVYLAEALGADGLKRIVAVKILKAQWSDEPDLLNRTRDEARLLARLHHRNILRVEALAEHSGQPAIIMEFVDGVDLGQLIEKTGRPVPPRAALQIARDAAGALQAAYFRTPYGSQTPLRVVHRDIKPSNIMVSVEGEVKVLDFGTAHYENEIRLAQTGALRLGSLKYMSPERRSGDRGDHSCDIYALGVVLIEMLLGELLPIIPLDAGQHDHFIAAHIARIPRLGMPNPEWESALQEALTRMCAHEPSLRLNAEQLLELLRNFSDQATGSSLDSFAAGQIQSLARALYGDGAQGAHTGNRIMVVLTGSGSHSAPAQPIASPGALSPGAISPGGLSPGAISPGRAEDAPPRRPVASPSAPKKKDNTILYAAVGLGLLGGLGLVALVVVGVALYLLWPQSPEALSPGTVEPTVIADGVSVALSAESEDLQWIRLNEPDGTLIVKADPRITHSVPAGDYQLSAKVVGHPVARADLTIEGEVSLDCVSAEKGKVTCTDGDLTLELAP